MLRIHNPQIVIRRLLIALTLLFGLLLGATLANVRSARPFIMRFDVPLAPHRQLHLHVGSFRSLNFGSIQDGYLRPVRPVSGDIWQVEAWYRAGGGRPGIEVADFELPMWPLKLLVVAAPIALLVVLWWRPGKEGATA